MTISSIEISKNRYAPAGLDSVNLYACGTATDMTLVQLIQAVCLRSAAICEAQSVMKMNMMTSGSQVLDDASRWLVQIADGSAVWSEAKKFLMEKMGIPEDSLPSDIDSYTTRMEAAKALQDKMNLLAQSQQEDMIDLQTLVNRRDVAYSTSSGVVRAVSQSQNQDAANFVF